MRRTHAVALILTAALTSASVAAAQDAAVRPMTFGVSGGLSMPVGDLGDGVKSGFNAGAHLAFKPATFPFGVRVEGQFNRFAYEATSDANLQIISGTANAVFGVPAASSAFRPYVIGGIGVYNAKSSVETAVGDASNSDTNFGLNAGAGIEFGLSGLATFVEARFNSIFSEGSKSNFIPITFGIKF